MASCILPDLWTGEIATNFHAHGKILSDTDKLNIRLTGIASESAQFLRSSGGKPGPVPLEPPIDFSFSNTSHSGKLKGGMFRSKDGRLFKYSSDEGGR